MEYTKRFVSPRNHYFAKDVASLDTWSKNIFLRTFRRIEWFSVCFTNDTCTEKWAKRDSFFSYIENIYCLNFHRFVGNWSFLFAEGDSQEACLPQQLPCDPTTPYRMFDGRSIYYINIHVQYTVSEPVLEERREHSEQVNEHFTVTMRMKP